MHVAIIALICSRNLKTCRTNIWARFGPCSSKPKLRRWMNEHSGQYHADYKAGEIERKKINQSISMAGTKPGQTEGAIRIVFARKLKGKFAFLSTIESLTQCRSCIFTWYRARTLYQLAWQCKYIFYAWPALQILESWHCLWTSKWNRLYVWSAPFQFSCTLFGTKKARGKVSVSNERPIDKCWLQLHLVLLDNINLLSGALHDTYKSCSERFTLCTNVLSVNLGSSKSGPERLTQKEQWGNQQTD